MFHVNLSGHMFGAGDDESHLKGGVWSQPSGSCGGQEKRGEQVGMVSPQPLLNPSRPPASMVTQSSAT